MKSLLKQMKKETIGLNTRDKVKFIVHKNSARYYLLVYLVIKKRQVITFGRQFMFRIYAN